MIAGVALLAGLTFWLWRRRKSESKKSAAIAKGTTNSDVNDKGVTASTESAEADGLLRKELSGEDRKAELPGDGGLVEMDGRLVGLDEKKAKLGIPTPIAEIGATTPVAELGASRTPIAELESSGGDGANYFDTHARH